MRLFDRAKLSLTLTGSNLSQSLEGSLRQRPGAEDDDLSDFSEPPTGNYQARFAVLSKSSSPVLTQELMPSRIENLTLGL